MDNFITRVLKPIGTLIIGSLAIQLISMFSFVSHEMSQILVAVMLFCFGMSLDLKGKINFKVFSITQLIVLALAVLLYLFQTKIVTIALFEYFKKVTVASDLLLNVLYVYFGWLFKGSR